MEKKKFLFMALLIAFFICNVRAAEKIIPLSTQQRKSLVLVRKMVPDADNRFDYYVSKELVKYKDGMRQLVFVDEMPRADIGCDVAEGSANSSINAKALKSGVYQLNLIENGKTTESRKFVKRQ